MRVACELTSLYPRQKTRLSKGEDCVARSYVGGALLGWIKVQVRGLFDWLDNRLVAFPGDAMDLQFVSKGHFTICPVEGDGHTLQFFRHCKHWIGSPVIDRGLQTEVSNLSSREEMKRGVIDGYDHHADSQRAQAYFDHSRAPFAG